MLTLKTPLQLHSIRELPVHADELGERILGNYRLMSIQITPQDLLHMTTLPPEVYVALESDNHFVTEQNFRQKNEWKIDVINQLVNRILLYETPWFTYQDEVYISTVLNRLGITDTAEFMEQVRRIDARSESVTALLQSYYENAQILKEKTDRIYEKFPAAKQGEQSDETRAYRAEPALWQTIFSRIRTAECSNILCDYRMAFSSAVKNEQETTLIQQMQQADAIELSYMKQYIFGGDEITLPEQINYYEKKPLYPAEITEKTVLSQLAAAMLTQLVQEFGYQRCSRKETEGFRWTDFTRAFYESAEDVISRFEEYQSGQVMRFTDISYCLSEWNGLMQKERDLVAVLEYFDTAVAEEETAETAEKEAVFALLENQNLQKQFRETLRILETFSVREFVQENERIDRSFLEALLVQQQSLGELHEVYESTELRLHETDNERTETLQEQTISRELSREQFDFTALPRTAEVQLSEGEAEAESLVHLDYVTYLNEVNQRNIEMNRRYLEQEGDAKPPQAQTIVLSRESARKSALRALEHPQEVLEEMYENGHAISQPDSDEIEHYLSLTDEQTKAFYQKLLYGRAEEPGETQTAATVQEGTAGGPVTGEQESAVLLQILENQQEQYLLMQEILEQNLTAQELIHRTDTGEENAAASAAEASGAPSSAESRRIRNQLKLLYQNQLRQKRLLETVSDEKHSRQYTQQIAQIRRLIQQTIQQQRQLRAQEILTDAAQDEPSARTQSTAGDTRQQVGETRLQHLVELQNTYLNELDVMQSVYAMEPEGRTDILYRVTDMQAQYTRDLRQVLQYSIFSPVAKISLGSVPDAEAQARMTEQLAGVQTLLRESRRSLESFYHDRLWPESEGESAKAPATLLQQSTEELARIIRTEHMAPAENEPESAEPSAMVLNRSQVWNEDMVEEILSPIRDTIRTARTTTEQHTTENVVYRQQVEQQMEQLKQLQQMQENRQEFVKETTTTISEMIQQNLRMQLNEISGQVYQKIERKLDGERRRRGY